MVILMFDIAFAKPLTLYHMLVVDLIFWLIEVELFQFPIHFLTCYTIVMQHKTPSHKNQIILY
jgi:hypothetical protein